MKKMKRVGAGIGKVALALLGGILFPVLIWVALGVAVNQKLRAGGAQMEKMKRIGAGIGKVALALVGGILFPVLIWVALGVAVNQKLRERGVQRRLAPTLGEILQNANVNGGVKAKPILIVDDEAVMRDSLKDWLTDGGYEVETAGAGDEALRAMEVKEYEIAILDLRLPGKDGIQILKEARAKRPQLKGIIITAYPSVQTAVAAMKEGAVDYLPKPLNMNELENVIRNVLGPVQLQIKPETKGAAVKSAVKTRVERT